MARVVMLLGYLIGGLIFLQSAEAALVITNKMVASNPTTMKYTDSLISEMEKLDNLYHRYNEEKDKAAGGSRVRRATVGSGYIPVQSSYGIEYPYVGGLQTYPIPVNPYYQSRYMSNPSYMERYDRNRD